MSVYGRTNIDYKGAEPLPDRSVLLIYQAKARLSEGSAKVLAANLGFSRAPDTGLVAVTSIHSDKLSYQSDEKMTVEVGLKNQDTASHAGEAWWRLKNPELGEGEEGAWIQGSQPVIFTLGAGEERELSIIADAPSEPGSYELMVWVRVFIDKERKEATHSDGAYQRDRIEIR